MIVGDVINSKYEILEVISKKNGVTTCKCANIYLGNQWLIKKVEQDHPEYKILLRLSHNRIPKIIDYFKYENGYYYVMTSIPGITLDQYLNTRPMTRTLINSWLKEIAEILEHIHTQGIIHGDINTHNILIDGQNSLYLIDFGSSFQTKDSMSYTPFFVAPERLCDTFKVDYRSDFYSLGCVLKILLNKHGARKTHGQKKILKKLLAIAPKDRIQNAYEIMG